MNNVGHNPVPEGSTAGRGIVVSETSSVEPSTRNDIDLSSADDVKGFCRRGRRGGASLSVDPETIFADAAIRGFIDDWLVPMLVDRFIESRLEKESQENESK
jgi:hypothetical protein